MKANISHSKRSCHSKSVISRIQCHYSLNSPKKAGRPQKANATRGQDNAENLNGESVQHCSWNCSEQGKDLSWHTVSQRLREFGLKAYSAVTKPLISRKNQKAILTFAVEHVVWREFTLVMKARLIYLGLVGDIMFVVKLGKD